MCYNISINSSKRTIEEIFKSKFEEGEKFLRQKLINGFTNPKIPVITHDRPNKIQLFNWGLIPSWIKSYEGALNIRNKTLNAKSETVKDRPSFKNLIGRRHCMVIVDGFYEWRHEDKEKIKHLIHIQNNELFVLAGLWDRWVDRGVGKIINSVTILTKDASGIMKYLHNSKLRQPIIMDYQTGFKWNHFDNYQEILNNAKNINLKYYPI